MAAACLMAGAASAASTLVNGNFDRIPDYMTGLHNGLHPTEIGRHGNHNADVYDRMYGWTVNGNGLGVEYHVEKTQGLRPESGRYYIELDGRYGRNGRSNVSISQDLILDAGKYELSFYYSPREKAAKSNAIRYSVTGASGEMPSLVEGTILGPNQRYGTSLGTWTRVSANFSVSKKNSPVSIVFAAIGAHDQRGGFMDFVSLKRIKPMTGETLDTSVSAVPVPAALPLLATAIAGIAFAGWRERAA